LETAAKAANMVKRRRSEDELEMSNIFGEVVAQNNGLSASGLKIKF
jgi:hypothetical protein